MIGGQRDVGALALQDVEQPMGQLDIAVAGALGLAQRLDEGVVADPVQLAGDGLEADVGHRSLLPLCVQRRVGSYACAACARPDGSARRDDTASVVGPVRRHPAGPAELAELCRAATGSTAPAGIASSTSQSS